MQGYRDRVRAMRIKSDVETVQKFIADIDADWGANKDTDYYHLIVDLCGAVSSWSALDGTRSELVYKLATTGLDSSSHIPIDSEVRLLLFLQADPKFVEGRMPEMEWEKQRLVRVRRWLTAWQNLRVAKGKLPSVSGLLELNVDPPSGTKQVTYPGMPPELIKDPVLRKEYQDAIAKNKARIDAHNKKIYLERLEESFVRPARRYISQAYCRQPYRLEELEKNLEEFGIAKEDRVALMTELSKCMGAKTEQASKTSKTIAKMQIKELEPAATSPYYADVRVRKKLSFNLPSPKVEDILQKLRLATGVDLVRADDIQNKYWATGSVSYVGVPAWQIMDNLAAYKRVEGRWEKEGTGYRLVRNGNPVVLREELKNATAASADESRFWLYLFIALGAIVISLIAALAIRHHKSAQE